MLKMACREKHVYTYSPAESIKVQNAANDLERLYAMQGFATKIDISTVTITVTASRVMGVETEGESDD